MASVLLRVSRFDPFDLDRLDVGSSDGFDHRFRPSVVLRGRTRRQHHRENESKSGSSPVVRAARFTNITIGKATERQFIDILIGIVEAHHHTRFTRVCLPAGLRGVMAAAYRHTSIDAPLQSGFDADDFASVVRETKRCHRDRGSVVGVDQDVGRGIPHQVFRR
jgi:hypothetical protein